MPGTNLGARAAAVNETKISTSRHYVLPEDKINEDSRQFVRMWNVLREKKNNMRQPRGVGSVGDSR